MSIYKCQILINYMEKRDIYSIVLKILMSISAIFYLIVFIQEITPPYFEKFIGVSMVLYLFILFIVGYYFSLKEDFLASGIFTILWYGFLWLSALFVWITDAGMVLVLGFPVFIFGILMFVKGILKKNKPKKRKKKK